MRALYVGDFSFCSCTFVFLLKNPKCLICLFVMLTMCVPQLRSPKMVTSRYLVEGMGLKSGNMCNLTFSEIKIHVQCLFLLLQFNLLVRCLLLHKYKAASSAKSLTLGLACSGSSLI